MFVGLVGDRAEFEKRDVGKRACPGTAGSLPSDGQCTRKTLTFKTPVRTDYVLVSACDPSEMHSESVGTHGAASIEGERGSGESRDQWAADLSKSCSIVSVPTTTSPIDT